jgi:hypothetical protein
LAKLNYTLLADKEMAALSGVREVASGSATIFFVVRTIFVGKLTDGLKKLL